VGEGKIERGEKMRILKKVREHEEAD